MVEVRYDSVTKRYENGFEAVKDLNLEIKDGEFLVLLGPSGCGKSTTLRMLAGLEDVSEGSIMIDGAKVNDLPPGARGLGMVFQSYALYPHMTIAENLSFGLRMVKGEGRLADDEIVKGGQQVDTPVMSRPRRGFQRCGKRKQRGWSVLTSQSNWDYLTHLDQLLHGPAYPIPGARPVAILLDTRHS